VTGLLLTVDRVLALQPCELWTRDAIEAVFREREAISIPLLDALRERRAHRLHDLEAVWLACRFAEEFAPGLAAVLRAQVATFAALRVNGPGARVARTVAWTLRLRAIVAEERIRHGQAGAVADRPRPLVPGVERALAESLQRETAARDGALLMALDTVADHLPGDRIFAAAMLASSGLATGDEDRAGKIPTFDQMRELDSHAAWRRHVTRVVALCEGWQASPKPLSGFHRDVLRLLGSGQRGQA
jgi:hypothetical protein